MSVQGVARPKSGMNVYEPASPFILQDLTHGTICTQGHTCVRHKVMMTHLRLTFYTEDGATEWLYDLAWTTHPHHQG